MTLDFQPLITDLMDNDLIDTVFSNDHEDLKSIGVVEGMVEGPSVQKTIQTSLTSTAANYTRDDVNPDSGTFVSVEGKWHAIYSHVSEEVHGIDIVQSTVNSNKAVRDLVTKALNDATRKLSALFWTNFMARLKSDIDATGAYTDNSVSRSTYPTLASYEENTDTQITLAHMRTALNNRMLNRSTGDESQYLWMLSPGVYDPFKLLVAALHTWNVQGVSNQTIDGGYQHVLNFEGVKIKRTTGMTVGDAFLVRPQDLRFRQSMAREVEVVPSGRHSYKFVMREGWHNRVDNPGFQGKLTLKD